ncbi:murein transglycosylase domain-containing protein [Kaarinaea lacus]
MLVLKRTVLILLAFPLSIAPIEANHKPSHRETPHEHTSAHEKNYKELLRRNKQILKAYDDYKRKAAVVWGDDAVVPDSKTDVTYRDNLQQRSIVDYEDGTVHVELALDQVPNANAVVKKLADAVEQTIKQAPDERSIIEIAENPTPPQSDKDAALSGLVAKADGTPLSKQEIASFKNAQARAMTKRSIMGSDGKKRLVFSTQFKLVPDHIRKRAEKYRDAVDLNAKKHQIPTPWIYAIMETESFFNPTAKSPVPAFGLMQLVPATGARDAYKFLFSKDKVVKDTYLYNAENNIELGVAYLHILFYRYLKHIEDPQSRQWATIAAYNTGVQNVVKSFSGKYSKKKHSSRWSWKTRAIKKINKMTPEQVYKHLRRYLPAKETRDYIKKVRERMGKYSA